MESGGARTRSVCARVLRRQDRGGQGGAAVSTRRSWMRAKELSEWTLHLPGGDAGDATDGAGRDDGKNGDLGRASRF